MREDTAGSKQTKKAQKMTIEVIKNRSESGSRASEELLVEMIRIEEAEDDEAITYLKRR